MNIFEKLQFADAIEVDGVHFVRHFDYDAENKTLSIRCEDGPELEIDGDELAEAYEDKGRFWVETQELSGNKKCEFSLTFYKLEEI
jgi:hypothetical protein